MPRLGGTLTLAVVGKLRTSYWQAAQQDYLRRLERYTTVELVEVRDIVGSGAPDAQAMQREGEALLKATADARQRVALTIDGLSVDSPGLARALRRWIDTYQHVAFIIGGPTGLSPEVLNASAERLSLSSLTFPHELARVMLLEQLYRAVTILSGEKYHK